MKSGLLVFLILVVLLGCASAGVATYLLLASGSADARAATPAALETPVPASTSELREEIEALAEANRKLRQELDALADRSAPASRAPVEGFVSRVEFDAFRREVRASMTTRRDLPESVPEELKEQVAGALIDIRKEERFEAVRQYQEKRTARLEDDLAKLEEKLDLSGYQRDEMRAILLAQYEREDEVRRLWEEGADDELLGEQKQAAGEQFRTDLAQTLTPEQLDTFWALIAGRDKD